MRKKTQNAIRAHALEAYPNEACGVIINEAGAETYVRCTNEAPVRKAGQAVEHFRMSPADLADAEDRGTLVAIVHSHPDESANPTESDRVMCEAMAASGQPVAWYIVSVYRDLITGEMATSDIQGFVAEGWQAPLVGRRFFHGVVDCWSLVRDWWKRERDIDLPDFPREDDWWNKGQDMYRTHFEEAGFIRIGDKEPLQPGDLIVMQIRAEVPNHGAVYLGNGLILHHMYDCLSTVDVYAAGGDWYEKTVFRARHRSMME